MEKPCYKSFGKTMMALSVAISHIMVEPSLLGHCYGQSLKSKTIAITVSELLCEVSCLIEVIMVSSCRD